MNYQLPLSFQAFESFYKQGFVGIWKIILGVPR